MNREIKFRVWDNHNQIWLKESELTLKCKTGSVKNKFSMGEIGGVTICQFTGLKDNKGKDLFEGDYIKIQWHFNDEETVELVTWDNVFSFYKYGNNPICELVEQDNKFEIIGNIYENPNLLNPKP